MESGKRGGAEAGSSSGYGVGEERREIHDEMSQKPPSEVRGLQGEDDEDVVVAAAAADDDESKVDVGGFVPGPLLSLKEQIEKDKVFPFLSFLFLFKWTYFDGKLLLFQTQKCHL